MPSLDPNSNCWAVSLSTVEVGSPDSFMDFMTLKNQTLAAAVRTVSNIKFKADLFIYYVENQTIVERLNINEATRLLKIEQL